MTTPRLRLEHPLGQLEIDMQDLDPSKWDISSAPRLYLVEGVERCEYMPAMELIEMEGKGRIEAIVGKELRARFRLTQPVNAMWRMFFEKYRGDVSVIFEERSLIIRCQCGQLKRGYE